MNKIKEPIIFEIGGTRFEVDTDRQLLRQVNDPANEISFIRDMHDQGTHYRLFYDLKRKTKLHDTGDTANFSEIRVPQLTELDPEGMAAKYGFTVEQLKDKNDFQVIVDQQALERRRQGILPKINIAGEAFIVDLRLHELRHAANFHPVLSLKSFELSHDGWHYEAYYHPVIKQVVELDPKLLEFPDGVIKIRIPNELGLDPLATAAIYGMDERTVLRLHPIQKELKAELVPLGETGVPALIRRNKEALRQEHAEIARRIRPKHRPRF